MPFRPSTTYHMKIKFLGSSGGGGSASGSFAIAKVEDIKKGQKRSSKGIPEEESQKKGGIMHLVKSLKITGMPLSMCNMLKNCSLSNLYLGILNKSPDLDQGWRIKFERRCSFDETLIYSLRHLKIWNG
ncbi:UNVERIFIED_CONTAM: hypothetical protein Sangu_0478300 [Sesamum angustifolium]|uniref:Uncharacterized protein n=1 Tax=Sesamum angustifolium TaxID=2727405 RepID=A0AAW2Q7R8_9LAMI